MSYTIRHIGGARFEAHMEGGEVRGVGPNLIGMIRYTYFEDFSMPPAGWEVGQEKLLADYYPKVFRDIQSGKISAGKHDFDAVDWIEKI